MSTTAIPTGQAADNHDGHARGPEFRAGPPIGRVESFRRFSWANYRSGAIGVDSANRLHRSTCFPIGFDIDSLRAALQAVGQIHPALCAQAGAQDERPWLDFSAPPELNLVEHARAAPTPLEASMLISPYVWRPFELETEALLRCRLDRFADADILTVVLHHFVCDAFSIRTLWSDLLRTYGDLAGRRSLAATKPSLSYFDYLAAISAWRTTPTAQAQLTAAMEEMAPLAQSTGKLSAGPAAPAIPIHITGDLLAGLRAKARDRRVSLFCLLLAAQAAALGEALSAREVALWSVTSGREHPLLLNTVGYLADRIAYRVALDGDDTTIAATWKAISQTARRSFIRSDFLHDALAQEGLALVAPGFNFTPLLRAPGAMASPPRGPLGDAPARAAAPPPRSPWAIPLAPPPHRSGSGRDISHYWFELAESEHALTGAWRPKSEQWAGLADIFLRKLADLALDR